MPNARIDSQIQDTISLSTGYVEEDAGVAGLPIIQWLTPTGEMVPPWWSRSRDDYLRDFWKKSNHLSIIVYNAQSKMVNIPPIIEPRDTSISSHIDQAAEMSQRLLLVSEFGNGWNAAMEKFYEDYLTQDNGAFLEIIGEGDPTGPIIGMPYGVRHLSSRQCQRTGDPNYPVVFTNVRGERFKIYRARVIALSQMPSPIEGMNGVGFCSVSRAIEIAQTLVDIIRYKQERLGSRPHSKMLVGKGIRAAEIMSAFQRAEETLTNQGLQNYARIVAIGSENTEIGLEAIDLNHLDPFDEETSITYGMYAIASAFGLDISEVWPTAGKASTTDARIAQARARGKLPSQATSALAAQLNLKFLPPNLALRFDFRDDEEDQQRAIVRDIRGRHRMREMESGALTERAARLQMFKDGDVDQESFEEMEMGSGRLDDGTPISRLFFSQDPPFNPLLNLGVENPLDTAMNDWRTMLSIISLAMANTGAMMNETSSQSKLRKLRQAYAALEWLHNKYMVVPTMQLEEEAEEAEDSAEEDAGDTSQDEEEEQDNSEE